jgi:Sec-independent protein secretion pathway component TatC
VRIIRSLIAIAVGMLVAFFFYDRLSDFVLGPTIRALPPGTPLIYMRPGEGLSSYMTSRSSAGSFWRRPT